MSRPEYSHELGAQKPDFVVEPEKNFDYDELPAVHAAVDSAIKNIEAKNLADLDEWQKKFLSIKADTSKLMSKIEAESLLEDLQIAKINWQRTASQEMQNKLDVLIAELKKISQKQVGTFDKLRKWLVPVLAVTGLGIGKIAHDKHAEFEMYKNETGQLSEKQNEFTVPTVPDSVLLLPEQADIPQTKDLFRQFERYVNEHQEKGLDLSVEESKPGLLGVYLKFGRQIDRSVKFSDKFLPELAKRLNVSEATLQDMQKIFHESIYVQPPTMGGGGTSSVFYTSENILKFKDHEDFYANQLNASVELAKQKLPEIENAPLELQPKLTKALEDFLRTELAVRAYDERIKNAVKKQLDFELEGFEGAYNDDAPSLFARQAVHIEARKQAITDWYKALASVKPDAAADEHLAQLAVGLQGWSKKRLVALEVANKEGADGAFLGGDPEEWNDFVKKGDKDFRNNANALKTLLAEYASSGPSVAQK